MARLYLDSPDLYSRFRLLECHQAGGKGVCVCVCFSHTPFLQQLQGSCQPAISVDIGSSGNPSGIQAARPLRRNGAIVAGKKSKQEMVSSASCLHCGCIGICDVSQGHSQNILEEIFAVTSNQPKQVGAARHPLGCMPCCRWRHPIICKKPFSRGRGVDQGWLDTHGCSVVT